MSQVITRNFQIDSASLFINDVTLSNANNYLAISHTSPWANDLSPDVPTDCVSQESNFWRGMIGAKKITGNDLQLVVAKNVWAANTIYTAYSDKTPIFGTNFYVLTSDNNVYKCLANNAGANSTVMPTYTSVDRTHQESDGYIWKYMLSLSTADRQRFLTNDWFPVRKLVLDDGSLQWRVQQNAVQGGIHVINITSGGTAYTNVSNLVVSITGDGSGAMAVGAINTSSNIVSNITITTPGSGYHYANVSISGGGGANATANAVISPFKGHGSSAPNELGASSVMINIRLQKDENGKLSIQNDFRQIGIIKSPLVFGTSNAMSNTVFSQVYTVRVSSGFGDYSLDEYVFQGGTLPTATFSGRVVDWDSSNNVLRLTETSGSVISSLLTGITSGTSRFAINLTNPDVVPFSGDFHYTENITPITRASDQSENITTVLTF